MNQFTDSYLDWERFLRDGPEIASSDEKTTETDESAGWFSPVLIKLKKSGDGEGKYANTIKKIYEEMRSKKVAFRKKTLVDAFEMETLRRAITIESGISENGLDPKILGDVFAIAYRHEDAVANEDVDLFSEIKRGPPIWISNANVGEIDRGDKEVPVLPPTEGILGVIDDGIPFLNSDYATVAADETKQTRFIAAWLQSWKQVEVDSGNLVFSGVSLSEVCINEALEITNFRPGAERDAYRKLGDDLYEVDETKTSNHSLSHGASIMNIGGGESTPRAGNHFDAEAPRLLAVQLPPSSIRDTSGKRLDHSVLQGLRWMIETSLRFADDSLKFTPLVVNISLGANAAPKNGQGFLEKAMRAEVDRYQRWSTTLEHNKDGPRMPMRIVLAFGNGYRENLNAAKDVPRGGSFDVDWRVQPEDRTASYLEVRATGVSDPCLFITPPCSSKISVSALQPGHFEDIKQDGVTTGRVYREPDEDGRQYYVIALRPTKLADGPESPDECLTKPIERKVLLSSPGAWHVSVKPTRADARISLQVQRDDTPFQYRPHGRQSYLDHPDAHQLDPVLADYSMPEEGCPVTRQGSHSAQVSPPLYIDGGLEEPREIYTVGATHFPIFGDPCGPKMAIYSAAGSEAPNWTTVDAPTLCGSVEERRPLRGVRSGAVVSGSSRRLNGTSVAAPQVARALLRVLVANGVSEPAADLASEIAQLDLITTPRSSPDDHLRRGLGVLPPEGVRVGG